jgi:hypothetical protein
MKKIVLTILALVYCSAAAIAVSSVWKSSWTATADENKTLCNNRGIFHGVCVNRGELASDLKVYQSSSTAGIFLSTVAWITTSTATFPCSSYDVIIPSMSYIKGGTADITILYDCF